MKNAVRLAAVVALAAGSAACIGVDVLVKVKGDGSGTVERSLTMNPQALTEMKSSMEKAGFKETGDKKKAKPEKSPAEMTDKELMSGPFDPEEAKKEAVKMGEGVTFVSATPIREKDRLGAKTVFAFKDITKIKVNQKPMAEAGPGGKSSPEDDIRFTLARKGDTAVLKMSAGGLDKAMKQKATPKTPQASPPAGMDKMAEGMMEMMKGLLKGLRITIAVEVDGPIVKTNSQYVSGSRVTFLDLDFNALLADEKALKDFGASEGGSLEDSKAALAKVKGMKVLLDPEMVIEFKPN